MSQIRNLEIMAANGSFALIPADWVDNRVLAAGVAESHTIPTGPNGKKANYVIFSANCDFFVKCDATPAVPAADVTDGTGSEFNRTAFYLGGRYSTIGLISAAGGIVSMAFYM